jgi:DNA-binding LacI/PurR family transcriptional regulator
MAARLLLKRIEGDATASGSIAVRPELVVRESTGPVPSA